MPFATSRTRRLLAAAVLNAALAGPVLAQQPTPAPTPPPEATPAPEPAKIDVGGYVDTYYGYNFNKVDPLLRSFDVQHNTFVLSAAEVNFTKAPTKDSPVGFRTDLFFGRAADLTAAFEPSSDGKEVFKHVQQAYVSLLTGKVQWDAGKFVPVSDKVSLGGYLLNGWNNASEINGNKTVGLSATVKPSASLTWVANYLVGKETAGSSENRHLFDTTLTVAATSKLSLMANVDYGKEGEVSWWGVAAYAKLQATPAWALVGRYEYLDDSDGGFMTIGSKAQSLTLTSDHLIAGALKARLEYRLDFTDGDFFEKSDGSLTDKQSTVTVGLVYAFTGKI
jgi:hypothetical protein